MGFNRRQKFNSSQKILDVRCALTVKGFSSNKIIEMKGFPIKRHLQICISFLCITIVKKSQFKQNTYFDDFSNDTLLIYILLID